jgi:hypothetical protein
MTAMAALLVWLVVPTAVTSRSGPERDASESSHKRLELGDHLGAWPFRRSLRDKAHEVTFHQVVKGVGATSVSLHGTLVEEVIVAVIASDETEALVGMCVPD